MNSFSRNWSTWPRIERFEKTANAFLLGLGLTTARNWLVRGPLRVRPRRVRFLRKPPQQCRYHDDDEEQVGESVHDVREAHQQVVDLAAEVARGEPDQAAEDQDDGLRQQADLDRDLGPRKEAGEHVPAKLVLAKRVSQAGVGEDVVDVLFQRVGPEVVPGEAEQEHRDRIQHQQPDQHQPQDRDLVAFEPAPGVRPQAYLLRVLPVHCRRLGAGDHRGHYSSLIRGSMMT